MKVSAVFLLLVAVCGAGPALRDVRRHRVGIKGRVADRLQKHKERSSVNVCYDNVGCFDVPHSRSPLQRSPESPDVLDTRFFLFTRRSPSRNPEVLVYNDNGTSLTKSTFDSKRPVRIYIHGYMSRWNEDNIMSVVDAYLKTEDCNFVLMDWSRGARGPQYASAAANTEVVGRELGLLLLSMIERGLSPQEVHMIGFSLGAHVAGCASELVKSKGFLVGRITGLDAAGPLFRHDNLKEKRKKLDRSDAKFVDVLHTDSSPVFVDGFGLWEPIGHADYFANGGEQQPGCKDRHASVVVTSIEKVLTKETACSHIRANALFFETLRNKVAGNDCQFVAYRCPGGVTSFKNGRCFPQLPPKEVDLAKYADLGVMGQYASGAGIMYFVTRASSPYCGTQLQAALTISEKSRPTGGVVVLELRYSNYTTTFNVHFDTLHKPLELERYALSAAEYKSLGSNTQNIPVYVYFGKYVHGENANSTNTYPNTVYIDKIVIKDMFSNRWSYCGRETAVREVTDQTSKPLLLNLVKNGC